MTFSEKLTALRRERGWSQEELGGRLRVSRQTVSKSVSYTHLTRSAETVMTVSG